MPGATASSARVVAAGLLSEGDRIWVNIPKTGYVGVGIVTGERRNISGFTVDGQPLAALPTEVDYSALAGEPEETADYAVPVRWQHTVPAEKAFSETGLFGNQNSVQADHHQMAAHGR